LLQSGVCLQDSSNFVRLLQELLECDVADELLLQLLQVRRTLRGTAVRVTGKHTAHDAACECKHSSSTGWQQAAAAARNEKENAWRSSGRPIVCYTLLHSRLT
jgi:hypothetical protein